MKNNIRSNETNNLLPLIKWTGGKRKEIHQFKHLIPNDCSTYVEPFTGGGALFFYLNNIKGKNIINDIHPDLINFYNQIKLGKGLDIYQMMSLVSPGEKDYYQIRGHGGPNKPNPTYNKKDNKSRKTVKKYPNLNYFNPSDKIEEAFQFYYLRKTCYRGMLRYNAKGEFNIPWGKYKSLTYEDIKNPSYKKLLSKTRIENKDGLQILKENNNADNFVFLDPPYDCEFKNYGFDDFDRQSQIKLAEEFKTTKSKCMLVIGATDFIYDLYKDCNIIHRYPKNYAFRLKEGRVKAEDINIEHIVILNYIPLNTCTLTCSIEGNKNLY